MKGLAGAWPRCRAPLTSDKGRVGTNPKLALGMGRSFVTEHCGHPGPKLWVLLHSLARLCCVTTPACSYQCDVTHVVACVSIKPIILFFAGLQMCLHGERFPTLRYVGDPQD